MKALIISDTHIRQQAQLQPLRAAIEPYLGLVDIIVHAGDSVTHLVVNYLRKQKPLYIVAGNMDSADLAAELPHKLVFDFDRFKVGLIHGFGSPYGLAGRVFEAFAADNVDAIIYGHSHQPKKETIGRTLLLNPGSVTNNRLIEFNTLAILEAKDVLDAQIIPL